MMPQGVTARGTVSPSTGLLVAWNFCIQCSNTHANYFLSDILPCKIK